MKFLCDQMLSRLGKWLRAAGHDTEIVTKPISDQEVLALALKEARLLITRDRHFLNMTAALSTLLYLKNNDFESCIHELNQKMMINWLDAPFSRCLTCNTPFEQPNFTSLNEQIPLQIRQKKHEFWYCPTCQQIYWEGTHTKNMRHQLELWQQEALSIVRIHN